jgi:hypothetical protein
MPAVVALDGECWGKPDRFAVFAVGIATLPNSASVVKRALWAARRIKAAMHIGLRCDRDYLACWYMRHYRGACAIQIPIPLFVVEYPPVERMN